MPLFRSFFLGGFECSTHIRKDSKRLDLIASTKHDRFARQDYERLRQVGIRAARDAVRWYLVEHHGGYDWSSVLSMIRAARDTGIQVIWDLFHFGGPDGLDLDSDEFRDRFAAFARAFTRLLLAETDEPPVLAPINEISFLAHAAGDKGFFHPFRRKEGDRVKRQLVRATLAACRAIRELAPGARLVHTDPIINVIADPHRPEDRLEAENYRLSQYAAWDMIAGRREPELGGAPEYLDILGADYYIYNQWILEGKAVVPSSPLHLPPRFMLREVARRYGRPLFIAETGTEGDARPEWLAYIGREVRAARAIGVDVEGICLYPIVDHPGWEDNRHCPNGLWGYADASGERPIDEPYARELARQQDLFAGGLDMTRRPAEVPGVLDRSAISLDEKTRKSRESAAEGAPGKDAPRNPAPAPSPVRDPEEDRGSGPS